MTTQMRFDQVDVRMTRLTVTAFSAEDCAAACGRAVASVPSMSRHMPLLVAIQPDVPVDTADIALIVEAARQHGFSPMTFLAGSDAVRRYVALSGFAMLADDAIMATDEAALATDDAPVAVPLCGEPLIVCRDVSPGEELVTLEGDVIVQGNVYQQATIRAGGHILVYGNVFGMLHAGRVHPRAQIYAKGFRAASVSIGDVSMQPSAYPSALIGVGTRIWRAGDQLRCIADAS